MIRVYDGPGPDAQLLYEGPDGESFQIEFQPGQMEPGAPLFIAHAEDGERRPLNGAAAATVTPEEVVPETPHEELLQRVARRLAETSTYVDWVADQVDGSLDEVVKAVLAETVEIE